MFIHYDRATSHTSLSTEQFLERKKAKIGFEYITPKNIPIRSPDVAPDDFFRIWSSQAATLSSTSTNSHWTLEIFKRGVAKNHPC